MTTRQDIEALVNAYRQAELVLLAHLRDTAATATATRNWYENQGRIVRELQQRAREIMSTTTPTPEQIQSIIEQGWAEGFTEAQPEGTKPVEAGVPVNALAATSQEAVGALTVAGVSILRTTEDAFREMGRAAVVGQLASGANRVQRIQTTLDAYARRGLTSFTDRAGRRWGMDTYVEMVLRTGVNRAQNEGRMRGYQAYGVTLLHCSQHLGADDHCQPFQNKILSTDGQTGPRRMVDPATGREVTVDVYSTLQSAVARGLLHVNCRHTLTAYTPGMPLPDTIHATDEHFRVEQEQRYNERMIRQWKRMETTALTPERQRYAAGKVREWQARQRAHVKNNPWLVRRYDREQTRLAGKNRGFDLAAYEKLPEPKPPFKVPDEMKWVKKPTAKTIVGDKKAAAALKEKLSPSLGKLTPAKADMVAKILFSDVGHSASAGLMEASRDLLKHLDAMDYAKAVADGKAFSPMTKAGAAQHLKNLKGELGSKRKKVLEELDNTAAMKEYASHTGAKAGQAAAKAKAKWVTLKKPFSATAAETAAQYYTAASKLQKFDGSDVVGLSHGMYKAKSDLEVAKLLGNDAAVATAKDAVLAAKKALMGEVEKAIDADLVKLLAGGKGAADKTLAAKYKALQSFEEMLDQVAAAQEKEAKTAAAKKAAKGKDVKPPAVKFDGGPELPPNVSKEDIEMLLVLKAKSSWSNYDSLKFHVAAKSGKTPNEINSLVNQHISVVYKEFGDADYLKTPEGMKAWKGSVTAADEAKAEKYLDSKYPGAATKHAVKSPAGGMHGVKAHGDPKDITMPAGFRDAPEVELMAAQRAAGEWGELDEWVRWYAAENNVRASAVMREVSVLADERYPGALGWKLGQKVTKPVSEARKKLKELAEKYTGPTPPKFKRRKGLNKLKDKETAMQWGAERWESKINSANQDTSSVLMEYTSSFYSEVNTELRRGKGVASRQKGYVEKMDRAFDLVPRAPEDIEVHRGTTPDQFLGNQLSGAVTSNPQSWVGKEFIDHGYMSTSLGGKAAFGSKPIQMHLRAPKGTKMAYVDGERPGDREGVITRFPGELELIVQRGTIFYVDRVEKIGSQTHVWGEIRRQEH